MKYLVSWNVRAVGWQQAVVNTPEELEAFKLVLNGEGCDYTVRRLYTREDVKYEKPAEIKADDGFSNVYARLTNEVVGTSEDFIFSIVVAGLEEEVEYKINKEMLKRALAEYRANHVDEFDELHQSIKNIQPSLSTRTRCALMRAGKKTIADVLNCTIPELAEIRWIGKKGMKEIIDRFSKYGNFREKE